MLTPRGWWLLFVVVLMLIVGLMGGIPDVPGVYRFHMTTERPIPVLTLISLSLLIWFLGSLLVFAVQIRLMRSRLLLVRQLLDGQKSVSSLWADHSYQVRVTLFCEGLVPTPHLRLTDRLPYGATCSDGTTQVEGEAARDRPLELVYRLHCPAPGRIRFEGARLQCADLQGLFYYTCFVRAPALYRVLPAFADIDAHIPAPKRDNVLPTAGPHRYRRAGSGSELLDLRDYIPGDPPKTIAWKASARRDRLITKVFESEVPIRCTFFVDASNSVRVGPVGGNALTRLTAITAALVQASAGQRDLPGLCLFDQDGVRSYLRPARGPRHVIQIINTLADAAVLVPTAPKDEASDLLPLAYGFADEVYPDLLRKEVNQFPFWVRWLSPRFQSRSVRLRFWKSVLFVALGVAGMLLARRVLSPSTFPGGAIFLLSLPYWLILILAGIGSRLGRERHGLPTERNATLYRWRKKLSALLSIRNGLAPQGLGELLEDDRLFANYAQLFLAEHQVPFAVPLYGPKGDYLYKETGKIDVLARALLGAVARGKDNELLVLLVDLLEVEELEPLVRAIKVAVARHHQVVVICPWPPEVAPPGRADDVTLPTPDLAQLQTPAGLYRFIEAQTAARLHRAYHRLRQTLGRVGVPVHCVADPEAVRLVLDRLRTLRATFEGVR